MNFRRHAFLAIRLTLDINKKKKNAVINFVQRNNLSSVLVPKGSIQIRNSNDSFRMQ